MTTLRRNARLDVKSVKTTYSAWSLLLMFFFCQPGFGASEPSAEPLRTALLIGVSTYEHLPASQQLEGCENDVAAMQELLISRFGFDEEHVTSLTNQLATGEAIREALQSLQQKVRSASVEGRQSFVLVHFSGHGSQIADQDTASGEADESDGLDETLVPHDAMTQGGDADIRDDELFRFASGICEDPSTRLWLILDCCHSGSGARGATRIRKLDRGGIQAPARDPDKLIRRRIPENAVFMSACRANEVEPEYRDQDKTYGLLTRFLVEVLNTHPAVSKLDYSTLRDSIVARYRQDSRVIQAPVPTLEFGDAAMLEESVINGAGVDRPLIPAVGQVPTDRQKGRMQAGTLQGVTRGSLYELFTTPDQALAGADAGEKGNLWLRVQAVSGATAMGELLQLSDGEYSPASWPTSQKELHGLERHHELGESVQTLHVVSVGPNGEEEVLSPGTGDTPAVVIDALQSNKIDGRIRWGDVSDNPDLVLRIAGQRMAIFPAIGVPSLPASGRGEGSSGTGPLSGGWGPISIEGSDAGTEKLVDYFSRINRAHNLLRIAGRQQSTSSQIPLQLELMAVDDVNDDFEVLESHVWTPEAGDDPGSSTIRMQDGDRFTFRVKNQDPTGQPVYPTLLHIDSNMGIDQIHPWQPQAGAAPEGEQKLNAGETLTVDGYFECNGEQDELPIYGRRRVVALATREANRFYLLAQSGLPVTRSAVSNLEALLHERVELKTRGGFGRRRRPVDRFDNSWGAAILEWEVVPMRASPDSD